MAIDSEIARIIEPSLPNTFIFYNWPASYHGGAGAVNFADGHSEIHSWVDPRTKRKIGSQLDPMTGTPSPRNTDIGWVLERATARK